MKNIFLKSLCFFVVVTSASQATTPDPLEAACIQAATDAVLNANNNAPDPQVTPPAQRAYLRKIVTSLREYQIFTDKGVRYDVLTEIQRNGTCQATDVSSL